MSGKKQKQLKLPGNFGDLVQKFLDARTVHRESLAAYNVEERALVAALQPQGEEPRLVILAAEGLVVEAIFDDELEEYQVIVSEADAVTR